LLTITRQWEVLGITAQITLHYLDINIFIVKVKYRFFSSIPSNIYTPSGLSTANTQRFSEGVDELIDKLSKEK